MPALHSDRQDRRSRLLVILEGALAEAAEETFLHRRLAPDGKSVDLWTKKVELLEKACGVLRRAQGTPVGRPEAGARRERSEGSGVRWRGVTNGSGPRCTDLD